MAASATTRKSDHRWRSFLASAALHAAALLLISAGQPGAPGGVPERLYTLSYLGTVPGGGPVAEEVEVPRPPREAEKRPSPAPRPEAKPPTPKAPAPGQLLASTRGEEAVPLKAKPPERSDQEPAPPEPEGAPAAGTKGSGAGEKEVLPAPPRGSGMVAALPRLVYPKAAQNAGLKGTVGLRVTVGPDGRLLRVEVERSSGEQTLDEYARWAVERGLSASAWVTTYVLRVEARFLGGLPEVRVVDEPVEVGG
ncbi:MAG: TonB family protein [Bacillota bacterium]|nr:TonB family protein [Bacillota bacterium]